MARFQHEKLLVYEEAIALALAVDPLAGRLERRRYYFADQLRRAALSVVLNIAEGAAEFSNGEKARLMGLAGRSGKKWLLAWMWRSDSVCSIITQSIRRWIKPTK